MQSFCKYISLYVLRLRLLKILPVVDAIEKEDEKNGEDHCQPNFYIWPLLAAAVYTLQNNFKAIKTPYNKLYQYTMYTLIYSPPAQQTSLCSWWWLPQGTQREERLISGQCSCSSSSNSSSSSFSCLPFDLFLSPPELVECCSGSAGRSTTSEDTHLPGEFELFINLILSLTFKMLGIIHL